MYIYIYTYKMRVLYIYIYRPNYNRVCPPTSGDRSQEEKLENTQYLKFTLVFCRNFIEGLN